MSDQPKLSDPKNEEPSMEPSDLNPGSIGAEHEVDLEDWIFQELVEDRDVTAMACCPVNSLDHLATGIGGKVQHLVTSWMCDHFDRTNNAITFNERAARWAPLGMQMRELVARIVRRIHAHHHGERQHRAGP